MKGIVSPQELEPTVLSHKGWAKSQNGELGPPIPLFCILTLSAFLTILGTSISNTVSFTNPNRKCADTGTPGGFASGSDRSSKKANEGSLLIHSADLFSFCLKFAGLLVLSRPLKTLLPGNFQENGTPMTSDLPQLFSRPDLS